jgi:acetyl-CoA C-acetyltransferase
MREVSIVGIGSTAFGRHPQTPIEQLGVQAAVEALLDAGIERERIGALYLGNFISGPLNGKEVLAGIVADQLGLPNVPCTKVEGACASGGIAFRHAWMAIASGQCDAALVVGVETMTHASTAQTTAALNCAMDNMHDGPSGLTFPGLFGLAWRIHAQRYGTTRKQVSAVIRKNKANGLLNPLAQMGATLTDEQIEASAAICDPLLPGQRRRSRPGAGRPQHRARSAGRAGRCVGHRTDPWRIAHRWACRSVLLRCHGGRGATCVCHGWYSCSRRRRGGAARLLLDGRDRRQ